MKLSARVKDVMDENVVTVDANTTVSDAIRMMIQKKVWSVIVLERGLPTGVVVDHDVITRCVDKGLDVKRVKVREIMSSPLLLTEAEAPVGEAMMKMVQTGVRRLYIVEKGKVVGRITQKSALENSLNLMLTLSSLTSSAEVAPS